MALGQNLETYLVENVSPDVADRDSEDVGQLGAVNGSGTKLQIELYRLTKSPFYANLSRNMELGQATVFHKINLTGPL